MTRTASGGGRRRPSADRVSPSGQRRTVAAAPTKAPPPPKPDRRRHQTALTARAAVLAVALASVALAVALPFKIWLGQRGQIASLSQQTQAAQRHLNRLSTERQRWQDPAYIEAQAQQQLHYVLPGHKTYVVYGKPNQHAKSSKRATSSTNSASPWYSQLWQTDQAAGRSK